MKIKEPFVERWEVDYNHQEPAKAQIERAMRVCYKSAAKQTSTSYERMYNLATAGGHLNCLEHGTYYIDLSKVSNPTAFVNLVDNLQHNEHSRMFTVDLDDGEQKIYAIVNGRFLYEFSQVYPDFELNASQTIPTELQNNKKVNAIGLERITIHMELDRSIADEFVRHRLLCPLMESSRYVKYKGDMSFGMPISGISLGENNHIEPLNYTDSADVVNIITDLYKQAEEAYNKLIELNYTPQVARYVLPIGYTTHLVMTGFRDDWERFCERRMASGAHPNARVVAQKIKDIIDEDKQRYV